nr:hypothetical protein [Tanacetum cinerariifolium]
MTRDMSYLTDYEEIDGGYVAFEGNPKGDDEEENVTRPKIMKKIVNHSIPKIEFVKPRQQKKPARKTVKKAEHNRPITYLSKTAHSTVKRPIQKNTSFKNNNINHKVNTVRSKNVNTARPEAIVNVANGNHVNAVKASACWVCKPKTNVIDHVSKHNSASFTLKKFDYIDAQGRSKVNTSGSKLMLLGMTYYCQLKVNAVRHNLLLLDEAVYKELDDRLMRVATTASSLEAKHDSGNIGKTQSKETLNEASSPGATSGGGPRCQDTIGDTIAQTRFENVSKLSNDSLLLEKEGQEACEEAKVKNLQAQKIIQVGLTARVDSSEDEQNLDEDASKQRRIEAIDADEDITLVNDQDDAEMFDVNDLQGKEVFVDKEVADKEVNNEVQKVVEEVVEDIKTTKLIIDDAHVNVASEVNAASITTTESATATITTKEISLAQALVEIKITKREGKGIVLQEPSESPETTTTIPKKKSQDKGKAILIEEPVKLKTKDQIRIDEETTLRLQAEFDEEEQRLARERTGKELETNIALIET